MVLFFLCNFRRPDSNTTSQFLKVITSQIIRQNRDLAELVYEEYILQGHTSSIKQLKTLIPILLDSIDYVRMAVDGLDECQEPEQKGILASIRSFVDGNPTTGACSRAGHIRAAIFSRAVESLSKVLKKSSTINLSQESNAVQQSIRVFVHSEITAIRNTLENSYVDDQVLDRVKEKIVASAGGMDSSICSKEITNYGAGMFLWVQLILSTLRDVHSSRELELVTDHLPQGLNEA
jgi:hypothetical protein